MSIPTDSTASLMSTKPVTVSAPGKVLFAGGYIVLDRRYTGLVFGLDARIFVTVKPVITTVGVTFSEITVRSPQFRSAVWEYGYRLANENGGVVVTELRPCADLILERNVFVETALSFALSYVSALNPGNFEPTSITILADNDYYSTSGLTMTSDRFHNYDIPLARAHKTGLGSSAALITSLTAAIISFYLTQDQFDLSTDSGKRRLHNLSQAVHCAAQGKVGSGFDVASAVYGSCIYRRFSPELLADCGEPGTAQFSLRLRDLVDETGPGKTWDTVIRREAVKVPPGLRLVMCDVSGGSQTPAMVKKVLAWRAIEGESAERLLESLHDKTQAMTDEMVRLANQNEADTSAVDYTRLTERLEDVRRDIRELGRRSDVPIEPPEQTRLLDACTKLDGVVGGVAPGSGGYDAVALLVQDRREVLDTLASYLSDWSTGNACPTVSVLRVKQTNEGVRTESAAEFEQWNSL